MRIAPSIKRFGFGAAAALVLTSCLSEMPRPFPTTPNIPGFVPTIVPVVTSDMSLANARLKSGRVKYANSGKKASSATVGSISVETRALLGKDGATSFEATTGVFEVSAGVDRIEKTTLRALTVPTMSPIQGWPNAPYWQQSVLGLVSGDIVHLQASVKGRGVSKTEVLRVVDTVVRRPDLTVVRIDGASSAVSGQAVTFFANVAEQNGDHGAQANCVLSVDGAVVDQATAVWVDAGDVVTCQFAYSFSTTGSHVVSVSVTDVRPGDWDDANNSASKTVEIVSPGTPLSHGQIDVFEEDYTWEYRDTRTGQYPVDNLDVGSQERSTTDFYAQGLARIPGPLQRVEAKLSMGSTTVFEGTLTQLFSYRYVSAGITYDCVDYSTMAQLAQSCTSTRLDGSGDTWLKYINVAGTVTYYGHNLYCSIWYCDAQRYPYSDNSIYGSGQRYGLTAGSSLRVQLTFVDATGENHVVDQTVLMEDFSNEVNQSTYVCKDVGDSSGEVCMSRVKSGMLLKGKVGSENPLLP